MASLKLAKKQAKQNEKRRIKNLTRATRLKTAIRKALLSVEKNEPIDVMLQLLRDAEAQLARAKNKHLLHANAVQRKISSIAKKVAYSIKSHKATA